MKGFIELPQAEGMVLVNVDSVVMVKPLNFKERHCSEVFLSLIQRANIFDVVNDTPPSKAAQFEPLKVFVTLPYADVLKLIAEAL